MARVDELMAGDTEPPVAQVVREDNQDGQRIGWRAYLNGEYETTFNSARDARLGIDRRLGFALRWRKTGRGRYEGVV